jgi:antitoxin component YwqK of YwqJK toxin-antitoxin module
MRTFFITGILFIFFISGAKGQDLTKGDDGLFYGPDNKPFTGAYEEFYPSGQLKMKMNVAKGLVDGQVYLYFSNGVTNEIRSYKEGEMHGQWITWNEQGQKIAEAEYYDGLKHGKWYVWNDEGVLLYDMSYNHGARSGTWKMFDHTGALVSEKDFD